MNNKIFPDKSYWFNRFQVINNEDNLIFRDNLTRVAKTIPKHFFQYMSEDALDRAYFRYGFLNPILNISPFRISSDISAENSLFWQFPCLTEKEAFLRHEKLNVDSLNNPYNIYLPLPWATLIDKGKNDDWDRLLRSVKVIVSGYRNVLHELGASMKVHTVCQHIFWERLIDTWETLGLTDIWLSHCPHLESIGTELSLHAWSLYPVNYADKARSKGLERKNVDDKKIIASFMGASLPYYLSDVREKLLRLNSFDGFYVELKTEWHYEKVVYEHQVKGVPITQAYSIDDSVFQYNELLSNSIFSFCPAGAGLNTLRLWESLSVGTIPILFNSRPVLPSEGLLTEINWQEILIFIDDNMVENIPKLLSEFSYSELVKRQELCLEAFDRVQKQLCFR